MSSHTCRCSVLASQAVAAHSLWRFLAIARSFEQWQQRFCAHERQRWSAVLRQQACSLARQDASTILCNADDIRVEALQRKWMRVAVIIHGGAA